MTRRNARELIMQMLYEYTFHNEEDADRLIGEKLSEIRANEDGSNKAVIKFIEEEYYGVLEHLDEIDELINKSTQHWTVSRIAKVDLGILRLATYELKWRSDVPHKVVVNEALEIAKAYSTDKSPQFINGILGNVIKLIEG
ncbi:transcription antitermination factor NusB [Cellulosilyticum sp. I15G10I2]|uniref:transcription antitermination factor NusB n=1 Tax=Cellulosilyticum sp. I15G10I2 TaxID=1892843 RepID=UPI00085CB898|nr:transcription antitermination factor NusB [Cellulosilyticum sp. I15G10I2]